LLLTPAAQWPTWVSAEVRAHQQALEALAEQRGCRLIDLALGFARQQMDLEAVVLGLCSVQELRALQAAWAAISPWQAGEWRTWALHDPGILDPRRWPR
jgi:aryl-alcohol dehydrogenase-like predicted oxidoreductase